MLFVVVILASGFIIEWGASLEICIIATIGLNILIWLIAPTLSDRTYRLFYKMNWSSIEELRKTNPKTANKIEEICTKYQITLPKLGLINDKNPSAFTYGSGKRNWRIIISQWILDFLNDDEVAAVFAHELGHIKNNDFIIMTVASTSLQLIYQIYRYLIKVKETGKKKWWAKVVALIAYIAYIIWQYILLYLSRTREYYADKFAAEHTDANTLSSALIKIAMGILATPEKNDLIKSTQHMNIANVKVSENIGLSYYNATQNNNQQLLYNAMLYDIKNPRAQLFEFNSTHPLSGKRIKALMTYTSTPMFDFTMIESSIQIDKSKMWNNFFLELIIFYLPYIAIVATIIWLGYYEVPSNVIVPAIIVAFALWLLINNIYKYNKSDFIQSTIAECMWDIYASPMRWKYIELQWKVIGQGIPWYIFSEDMMIQDKTGIIYMDYQSPIPLVWNLIFALKKLKKFIDQDIVANWRFFRTQSSLFTPSVITCNNEKTKSYQQWYGIFIPIGLIAIAVLLYLKETPLQ